MIGLDITEQEYRDIDEPSYSLLAKIDREGKKGLIDDFKPNESTVFGQLVEDLACKNYKKEKYKVLDVPAPTDKLAVVFDRIATVIHSIDPEPSSNLEDYREDIIDIIRNEDIDYYKNWKEETRVNSIIKETSSYWKQLADCKGKSLISQAGYDNAVMAANTLRTHEFTKDIFNPKDKNIETFSQVKVVFQLGNYKFKSMLDWIVVDHKNKVIKPYDLKTGSKPIGHFQSSFHYWRYDIQAYLYVKAIYFIRQEYFPGYNVEPFRFIYISREDVTKPIIFETNDLLLDRAYSGYHIGGKGYKGVLNLILEYHWYKENPDKDYCKPIYESKGVVMLNSEIMEWKGRKLI